MTARLKLAPLPNRETVRLHLMLPVPLRDELLRYAQMLNEGGTAPELELLIPHMLDSFIRSDRAFRRANRPVVPSVK